MREEAEEVEEGLISKYYTNESTMYGIRKKDTMNNIKFLPNYYN